MNGITIYASRRLDFPKEMGYIALSDFGSAVMGDEKRNHNAAPDMYRSPEVMVKAAWSYPVDIWSVGCMVSFLYLALCEFVLCFDILDLGSL